MYYIYQLSGDEPLSLSVVLFPPEEIGEEPVSPDGAEEPEPLIALPDDEEGKAGIDEPLLVPSTIISRCIELEVTCTAIAATMRS